jgi:hypothetical protein
MSHRNTSSHLPRLQVFALDCPDPVALADFYARLTGGEVEPLGDFPPENVTWLEMMPPQGSVIAFQRVAHYVAPTWPEGPVPQQAHLEFVVDDLDVGEAHVLDVGATKAPYQPGTTFRVYLDPVGHPFCLVLAS